MDEAMTSEARDVITEIKTHYQRLVSQQNRLTPSANCNPANYYTHQNGIFAILDGRYGDSPNTIAPPVEIYHPVFASFVAEDRYDALDLPTDFVQKVAKLLRTVSQIATIEKSRQATTRSLLSDLLNLTIVQMVNRNSTSADYIVTYHRGSQPLGAAAIAIIEEKSELGSSGDASVQGSFSFIEHWADSNQEALRAACFCPSFVIAVAGSWIVICGAVLTSSAIVHRLTDYIWLGHSRAMDDDRALRLAPTAYKAGEQTINFKYVKPLKGSDASCATFLAAECEGAQRRIVVKFVERYGVRAHRLLAKERLAPELLYYGDIWLSGPAQRGCGPRKMVVMEYVAGMTAGDAALKNDGILPSGVHPAVYRAMSLLHKHGMVHGDVRLPNIIIEEDHEGKDVRDRVKIVDFDWAGEDGTVRYPLHLSTAIRWADGVDDYEPITAAHDDEMVAKLQQ
ncbi:hypothetical protein WOLCODRAFT_165848 [Wolfiporia cocos MD-104 SS10]|uniref:Protein kinase domain-containing protein n=1 Tax=Wolfiporia cocos (strain MD-104) TaxID=742152 RepID=A0A2H3J7W8_WOLCO|nr:hypothetical protein WOLCODRAFT_165848 [Wolfiporia cocos MD-104 SS10]